MKLKIGARYRSQACETEIIVVRAPLHSIDLTCGGYPIVETGDAAAESFGLAPDAGAGTLLGKRYTDLEELEVLVVRPGRGTLAVAGTALSIMESRVLPSSD